MHFMLSLLLTPLSAFRSETPGFSLLGPPEQAESCRASFRFPRCLPQPYARAAVILFDELDASGF